MSCLSILSSINISISCLCCLLSLPLHVVSSLIDIAFVPSYINEDKRKTEGQIAMFDIVNDIEGCPASILSSSRQFIAQIDVKLLLSQEKESIAPLKGYTLTLFLFTDLLEVCKKRALRRTPSLSLKGGGGKPPVANRANHANDATPHNAYNRTNSNRTSNKKSYKHLETVHLHEIKFVYDVRDGEELSHVFVISASANQRAFRAYPLQVEAVTTTAGGVAANGNDLTAAAKRAFLGRFWQQTALYSSSGDDVAQEATGLSQFDLSHSQTLAGSINKSKFGLIRTREKLERTFSFRKDTTNLSHAMSFSTTSLNLPMGPPPPPTPSTPQPYKRPATSHLPVVAVADDEAMIGTPRPSKRQSKRLSTFFNPFKQQMSSLRKTFGSTTSLNIEEKFS